MSLHLVTLLAAILSSAKKAYDLLEIQYCGPICELGDTGHQQVTWILRREVVVQNFARSHSKHEAIDSDRPEVLCPDASPGTSESFHHC